MASVNAAARQTYRYNRSAQTLHLTTGLCNWSYTAFVMWCVCLWMCACRYYICVCVCVFTSILQMEIKRLKQGERTGKKKKWWRDGDQRELLLGKYTSNKLMSRPVWSHNFSIQQEVTPGSSFIDFFPGFVAVFLSTNSKCRTSPALYVISL